MESVNKLLIVLILIISVALSFEMFVSKYVVLIFKSIVSINNYVDSNFEQLMKVLFVVKFILLKTKDSPSKLMKFA